MTRLDQSAAAKLLIDAGFHVSHTGGNCQAWRLDGAASRAGFYCLITDEDGTGLNLEADPKNAFWLAGLYDGADPQDEGFTAGFSSLRDAIAWCYTHVNK